MRRRSKKRQAEFDARPEIPTVSEDRTPVRPVDESFREFVRRLPCVVCLKPSIRGDPCHLHAKRVAGDWLEQDGVFVGNIYPGCRAHHGDQHNRGIESFAAGHEFDLGLICKIIGDAYQLGWSADGLGADARGRGYACVDVSTVLAGELPY